jgi:hypothetical protein
MYHSLEVTGTTELRMTTLHNLLERAIAGAWQLRVQSSLFLCIYNARHNVPITTW